MESTKTRAAPSVVALESSRLHLFELFIQGVFLATGVFSTCVAQFVFYQGAGDQKAMLLPLCNYLGMMLVGLLPSIGAAAAAAAAATLEVGESNLTEEEEEEEEHVKLQRLETHVYRSPPEEDVEPELTPDLQTEVAVSMQCHLVDLEAPETVALTRRSTMLERECNTKEDEVEAQLLLAAEKDHDESSNSSSEGKKAASLGFRVTSSSVHFSVSTLQLCIIVSVVLDFAGCIFSNLGLSMAGSGLYQVVYSSVICWSALLSRFILKKIVSKEEWCGIALVTFGLAFSALGESGSGRDNTLVLMGCLNTLVGAAFYGGNYVTGEYTLALVERPQPKELCLKIGAICLAVIAVYQSIFVLPSWDVLVTKPIVDANGNTIKIFFALAAYTLSQLAHGLTYFVMLGSSGAVTTGIMQSLRAVCVFIISSMMYCSQQESQCFDTKRGVATLIVVSGVMFYSWAKSQQGKASVFAPPLLNCPSKDFKTEVVAGKNHAV